MLLNGRKRRRRRHGTPTGQVPKLQLLALRWLSTFKVPLFLSSEVEMSGLTVGRRGSHRTNPAGSCSIFTFLCSLRDNPWLSKLNDRVIPNNVPSRSVAEPTAKLAPRKPLPLPTTARHSSAHLVSWGCGSASAGLSSNFAVEPD